MEKKEGSQEVAARMAREAAERARRAEIMSQIHKIEKEIEECEDYISGLRSALGQLDTFKSNWEILHNNGMKNDLVREVVIPGVLEGNIVNSVKLGMASALEQMVSCMTNLNQVTGDVEMQIMKLHQYMDKQKEKISLLRATI